MRIFAIDDEPLMLRLLNDAIAAAEPGAEIHIFERPGTLLEAISVEKLLPDVVFLDIEMPGLDGLSLAVAIKREAPRARIIFVTGYSQYALDAFRIHANGYLMKPVDAAAIREELDQFPAVEAPRPGKLQVQCFGLFEVFWQGEPLTFSRRKTKELFAYLVDRKGAFCSTGEVIAALWEDSAEAKDAKNYLRVLVNDLTSVLRSIGMADVLLRQRGQIAVKRDMLDCDYYRMLDGDVDALHLFRGEYMKQYSWAELTTGRLMFSEAEENVNFL